MKQTTNQSNKNSIEPERITKITKPMLIAGLSRECTFKDAQMGAPAQWEEFGTYLGNIPGQKEHAAYGLCFDMKDGTGIEYVTGVEVSGTTNLPEHFITKQLPSLNYAVFDHEGHVSSIPQTCDAIWKEWVPASGVKKPKEADFFFERYGENFDPETGTGDIEIWVPVQL